MAANSSRMMTFDNMKSPLRWLVVALLLAGCSASDNGDVYDPADYRPEVNVDLPRNVQQKQDALIRAFGALQDGLGMEELHERHKDIRLEEAAEEFYAEGALLHLFQWIGPPNGDELPVRMVMKKDEPGLPEVEYQRVYTVTSEDAVFVIRRKE